MKMNRLVTFLIVLLVGICLIAFFGDDDKANNANAGSEALSKEQLREDAEVEILMLQPRLSIYRLKNRKYPDQLDDLARDGKPVPPLDPWGKPFLYTVAEDGKSFKLGTGADTETKDDDVVYDSKLGDIVK